MPSGGYQGLCAPSVSSYLKISYRPEGEVLTIDKKRHPSITSKLAPAVLIAVLLAVWQLCSDLGVVPKFMLPSPTDVVTAFVEDFPALMTHARVSLL